ncbi:MAG: hypothetical protein R3E68_14170 [Burkholderiaceae bacterium]
MRAAFDQPGALAVREPATGETLWLLPEGALFDPAGASLFVADVHLGKAESFRRLGCRCRWPPAGTAWRACQR